MSLISCILHGWYARCGHLPERTSPGRSETVTRNTIRDLVPLGALALTTLVDPLYLESRILQTLISENILPSLAQEELLTPAGKQLPGLIPGQRREIRALNVPGLLIRFSNDRSLAGRAPDPYAGFTYASPSCE